jgi:anti-anti-sigma regulatory factor
MLRITIIDNPTERRLVLEGRLTELNISELNSAWENVCGARGDRTCIVDLRNATFIDQNGERILLRMKQEGAQFIACGISTTHRLKELGIKCKGIVPKPKE